MQVFISYACEDRELAKRLSQWLEGAGFEVWLDENQILPGDNWAEKVAQALKESQAMVVLVSPAAMESKWVRHEIEYALGAKEYSGRLVPVFVGSPDRIPKDKLPWILRRLRGIELTDQAQEEDLREIAEVLSTSN
ncbi:MAG: toll/interleukin-1 receptor domain-containing protein [Planctomycetes bacterium]|nr:toll/interleukin-1 receptor domain-containing protein [Planctomycetota bacterium]